MLESIYSAHELRVGLFTSPHLVSFTERLQVNRKCIDEAQVARLTEVLIERMGGADMNAWPFRPTFFEFVTIMALLHFAEMKCDLVVWETGLGGRLDATNIVTPLVSVITNVQRDHEQWLGETEKLIAAEKAGIIKPGVPVVTGASHPEAIEVIRDTARSQNSPLTMVSGAKDVPPSLPLLGEHQRLNAAVALATVIVLREQFPVDEATITRGLETVRWPGRLQRVRLGNGELLLDGAHNPDGARTLADAVNKYFPGREAALILGLFNDKSWEEMCEILVPSFRRVYLVPLQSPRTADMAVVRDFCNERWPEIPVELCENISAALETSSAESLRVIAGSLHLIGESMELLGISPSAKSERALNEWNAANR